MAVGRATSARPIGRRLAFGLGLTKVRRTALGMLRRNEEEEVRHCARPDQSRCVRDAQLSRCVLEHCLWPLQEVRRRRVLVLAHEDVQHRKRSLHPPMELRPPVRLCPVERVPAQAEEAPPTLMRPRVGSCDARGELAGSEPPREEEARRERLVDDLSSVIKRTNLLLIKHKRFNHLACGE